MQALITEKVGMTSWINDDGSVQAATLLKVPKNYISRLKTVKSDGYTAVQLASDDKNVKREIRITDELPNDIKIGDKLSADLFNAGDVVRATGISKGKGFTGVIKRHNFHSQRATHGAKGATKRPGSIGSMYPQKVFKGKRMAGHKGHNKVTTKNLKIILSDPNDNVIAVSGAIPGPNRGTVILRKEGES